MSREAMKQPKALRLADALDAEFVQGRISNHNGRKAAVELRRLHEALETKQEPVAWQEEIDELRQTLKRERVWVEKRHAAWHEGFEAGRKAERAFCAAVCDEKEEAFGKYYTKGLPALCAEAIRARGKK